MRVKLNRNILPTCTNLSVIVIDKPIGLGGTVYTSTSIFVQHLCTIYHLNKRFETDMGHRVQLLSQLPIKRVKRLTQRTKTEVSSDKWSLNTDYTDYSEKLLGSKITC